MHLPEIREANGRKASQGIPFQNLFPATYEAERVILKHLQTTTNHLKTIRSCLQGKIPVLHTRKCPFISELSHHSDAMSEMLCRCFSSFRCDRGTWGSRGVL